MILLNACISCRLLRLSPVFHSAVVFHSTSRSYYDILEIHPKATFVDIKAAYFKQTKKCHPDVSEKTDAEALFRELNEAYETLRNPDKRRLYDRRFAHVGPGDGSGIRSHSYSTRRHAVDEDELFRRTQQGSAHARNDGRPQSGAWQFYNFDEHYRAHYGEWEKRRRDEARMREEVENIIRHETEGYIPPSRRILHMVYMAFFETGKQTSPEEIRALRDFFLQYNTVAERCFQTCVADFNQRTLTPDEETCIDRCCSKYSNVSRRLMTVYWETQTERVAKKQSELEAAAAAEAAKQLQQQ